MSSIRVIRETLSLSSYMVYVLYIGWTHSGEGNKIICTGLCYKPQVTPGGVCEKEIPEPAGVQRTN